MDRNADAARAIAIIRDEGSASTGLIAKRLGFSLARCAALLSWLRSRCTLRSEVVELPGRPRRVWWMFASEAQALIYGAYR